MSITWSPLTEEKELTTWQKIWSWAAVFVGAGMVGFGLRVIVDWLF